ncbi:hypothetical protein SAMN04489835_1249 [Mycolicibacterium rutilum]|uniref:DUF302 domain-containing protein n=1 Tax=Mycolicibacterium rutilum TaxID=370526 RepID=A0A1H6J4Q7_MYCRU|nr:hypothetical protein [Mycolicibacterium rutilum]SEH54500.1 hypothetical protein SAMN04489835_1249 [Mycolicibacterium rutilum]
MTVPAGAHEHLCRRLVIALPGTYEQARERFERAVPVADELGFTAARSWQEVAIVVQTNAPHGFMRFRRGDVAVLPPTLSPREQAVQYLIGNHMITQTVLRREPSAMLHTALPAVIYRDRQGAARLAVDQPGLPFASYDDPHLTTVGERLDALLGRLICVLGGRVPESLGSALAHHYGLRSAGNDTRSSPRPKSLQRAELPDVAT